MIADQFTPPKLSPETLASRLAAGGFRPLPIPHGRKGCVLKGWRTYRYDPETAARDFRAPRNVGIMTGQCVGFDVDVLDEAASETIAAEIKRRYPAVLERIGRWPKRLFVFRTDKPFDKFSGQQFIVEVNGKLAPKSLIEVLGDGQQFVGFGIHPDTAKPYEWIGPAPTEVGLADLPVLNQAEARELVAFCDQTLIAHGFEPATDPEPRISEPRREPALGTANGWGDDAERIIEVLRSAPNELDRDSWVKLCLAVKGAVGEAGREAFVGFSYRWPGEHRRGEPERLWRTARPDGRANAGSVFHFLGRPESHANGRAARVPHPGAWPPLCRLDEPDLPRLNSDLLPGWLGRFANALALQTETPPELPATMALAVMATAAARRFEIEPEPGYREPLNLWLICALPPGTRKSAVLAAACRPLASWERDQAEKVRPEIEATEAANKSALARAKVLRNRAAKAKDEETARALEDEAAELDASIKTPPQLPRLWTSDSTPERLGQLLAEHGECMGWLSAEGGVFDMLAGRYQALPNLDLMLKAHAGDAERVDRIGRPSVVLDRPRLTLGLAPQPDVLRGLADKPGFLGRGLLGRGLFFLPPSPLGSRKLDRQPMPERVEADWHGGVRAILDQPPDVGPDGEQRLHVLRLTAEACDALKAFERAVELSMGPGGEFENATDWAGKVCGAAARVAGLFHVVEHAGRGPHLTAVSAETMERALEFMALAARHALASRDLMGASAELDLARRIWRWVLRSGLQTFSARDAMQALKSPNLRAAQIEIATAVLTERGYTRPLPEDGPPRPGRAPSQAFEVRPLGGGER